MRRDRQVCPGRCIALVLGLVVPWLSSRAEVATGVRLVGPRLEYRGTITLEANAAARMLLAAADPKPTVLWIESSGGSARAGLELGSWVFSEKLRVEVDTFCFSSCANYVFAAGVEKLLSATASLVWHGGPAQPLDAAALEQLLERTLGQLTPEGRASLQARQSQAQLLDELQRSLRELIAAEAQFFRMIGVDQRITTLGQDQVPAAGGPYVGWDYSLEDLAVLGVLNVTLKDGIWQPQLPLANGHVFRLALRELPAFAPRSPTPSAAGP